MSDMAISLSRLPHWVGYFVSGLTWLPFRTCPVIRLGYDINPTGSDSEAQTTNPPPPHEATGADFA